MILSIPMILFGCGISVDSVKQPIMDGIKGVMQAKTDVVSNLIPNGSQQVTINNQTITIDKEVMSGMRQAVQASGKLQRGLVDFFGSQVTDENLQTIAYYAKKFGLDPMTVLNWFK